MQIAASCPLCGCVCADRVIRDAEGKNPRLCPGTRLKRHRGRWLIYCPNCSGEHGLIPWRATMYRSDPPIKTEI